MQVGVLIGKNGDTIRYLQYNSGVKIQIVRDAEADMSSVTRPVELTGTKENISNAEKLIRDVIAEVCIDFIGTSLPSSVLFALVYFCEVRGAFNMLN